MSGEFYERAKREFRESDLAKSPYPCHFCCGTTFSIVYPCMEAGYTPFLRYEGEKKIDHVLICLNPACGKRIYIFMSETETIDVTLERQPEDET